METIDYRNGILNLDHEGTPAFFLEDVLDQVVPLLNPEAAGRVDYIDHHEFTMHRYKIADRAHSCTVVNLNDVLERYSRE
jgi:hypothetical protein